MGTLCARSGRPPDLLCPVPGTYARARVKRRGVRGRSRALCVPLCWRSDLWPFRPRLASPFPPAAAGGSWKNWTWYALHDRPCNCMLPRPRAAADESALATDRPSRPDSGILFQTNAAFLARGEERIGKKRLRSVGESRGAAASARRVDSADSRKTPWPAKLSI